MLKHIILSLCLLSMINHAFGITKRIDAITCLNGGIRRTITTFILGQPLTFLEFDESGNITKGKGAMRSNSIYFHRVTEDPATWIVTKEIFDTICGSTATAIVIEEL